jgi:hypothetical protein
MYIILRYCWSDIFQDVHASAEGKEIIHRAAFMKTYRVHSINSIYISPQDFNEKVNFSRLPHKNRFFERY